jgi:hypothetical protein
MNYAVKQGDCMASIAIETGFFWQTLWDRPENSALKQLRQNPNVLLEGDDVFIPDLTPKQESRASDSQYKFVRKGVPEKLRITLKDAQNKPRANLPYTLVVDGKPQKGTTNSQGELVESIPPGAKSGKLIIVAPAQPPACQTAKKPGKLRREITNLNLGHLDPVSEVSGIKARLANMKFYRGPIDSNLDGKTKQAISAFQTHAGLPATGDADDATKAALQKAHGH